MRDFFAFRTMITGSVIQVIFVLGLIGIVVASIGAIANDQAPAGLLILVFGGLLIVVFRMNSSLTAIRANTEALAPALPSSPVASPSQPVSTAKSDELEAGDSAALPASTETLPPEGWYDDSERPGHKRWWDGTAWGE